MSDPLVLDGDHYWKFRTAALEVALAEEQARRLAAESKLAVASALALKDRVVAELSARYPTFDPQATYRGHDDTCTLTKKDN